MAEPYHVVSVVGARPQFVKLAPVSRALSARDDVRHSIVHTGQHYDASMSDVFFDELRIPQPDVDLEIGSGAHGRQTGRMLEKLETAMTDLVPDAVLSYGDTNSTLAATLAAAKMTIPVAHVEAGLRSFNRAMPEEINRLVADHCSDRLYAPTPAAMAHLEREGLVSRSVRSGDVMFDAVLYNRELAEAKSDFLRGQGLVAGQYGLVTVHRPVNTDKASLGPLVSTLQELAAGEIPLIFPLHPRTRAVLGELRDTGALRIIEPLGYLDMLKAVAAAAVVVTDSGGLQKEAAMLGTPCITLRAETEWTETIDMGANVLVGRSADRLREEVRRVLRGGTGDWSGALREQYGDGDASRLIAADLLGWLGGIKP